MKQPILNEKQLKDFGFISNGKGELDDGDFYEWFSFRKNHSEITITYEYDKNKKFISGHVDFNCEILKGRPITSKDLQILRQIM
jgi:hypothetical protein